MTTPRSPVSVLMSVHNGARFLEEAVQSVLHQSFRDFEFVIIDDASTDTTPEILNGLRDRRVCILRNDRNLGLTSSLRRGLETIDTELVARMDADDVSEPDRLRKQIAFFEANPNVHVVGTAARRIDADGKELGLQERPRSHSEIKSHLLLRGNALIHGSVMFRRRTIKTVGGYRAPFRLAQDYDLWLRVAERYRLANINQPLYRYRVEASENYEKLLSQRAYAHLALDLAVARREGRGDPIKHEEFRKRFQAIRAGKFDRRARSEAWRDLTSRRLRGGRRAAALGAALRAVLAGGPTADNVWCCRQVLLNPTREEW